MKRSLYLVFVILLGSLSIFAQANQTEVVVRFQAELDIQNWQKKYFTQKAASLHFKSVISIPFNMAVLTFDSNIHSFKEIERQLLKDKDIIWVTPNKVNVTDRTVPNDPSYNQQWGMKNIGAEDFWAHTTGGVTALGDTIVVAVMESGTSLNHPDLIENIWHNYQEIPSDGIDNDNNGYVDDFTGWNAIALDDSHFYDEHGTEITGVIGAKGNNGLGISGVNWDIKLMPITFIKDNIASYFVAFDYLIAQRKLYNETKGAKGAFIVAVNESFGQDNARPEDSPGLTQWCEYMDSLGAVGILTIAATSNANSVNVDIVGDMPTTCPQEFLIAATAIDNIGNRAGAFGSTHVDLAAPGRYILTTQGPDDSYSESGGTSLATPHIAGAVALIYSYPCERWANYIKTNPSEAALLVKDWLLKSTDPLAALKDKSVSNGTLNIKNLIPKIESFCIGNILEPLALRVKSNLTEDWFFYEYDTPEYGPIKLKLYNMHGQLFYTQKLNSTRDGIQSGKVDLSNLPTGMYLLSLTQGNNRKTRKIVRK